MKWLGFQRIKFGSVGVDAVDLLRRAKKPHVIELAGDIEAHGAEPIQAPTIRAKTKALVCGRDRMSALLMLKAKTVWVHVVECTDSEAKELELAENIYRRADNRAELIAQLVKLKEQHLRAAAEGVTVSQAPSGRVMPASKAPQDSPKAQARKEVARAAGISTAAVRQAEVRSEARASKVPGPSDAEKALALPVPFQTYGLEVSAHDRASINLLIDQLKGWETGVKRMLAELESLENATVEPVLAPAHAKAIRDGAHALFHFIREAQPVGLCSVCKAHAELRAQCPGCGATGFAGRHQGDVPKELMGLPALVALDGKFVPYDLVVRSQAGTPLAVSAKFRAAQKRITVTDGDDRDLIPPPEDLTLERDEEAY